jgi:hypothetical protein
MTPLAGFVLALIAGWLVRDGRRAAAIVIGPFLAITAVQTWGIAAGDGTSPPSTVTPLSGAVSYYVVQAVLLAVTLAIAALLGTARRQRVPEPDAAAIAAGAAGRGRRTARAAGIDAVLTAVFCIVSALVAAPHPHRAEGTPPVQGLIGMGVLVISLIVLSVLVIAGRGRSAGPDAAGRAVAGVRGQAGMRLPAVAAIGAMALLAGSAGLTPAAPARATAAAPSRATAGAAGPAVSGRIHVYETGIGGRTDHDVITGAFTDFGVDHLNAADHGHANKIVLQKGTFWANVRKLNARIKVVSSNSRTCSLVLRAAAPVPLSHGTGRYRGIRGTLRVTVVNALIFPRKKGGGCDFDIVRATPRQNLTSVTGAGHISF